MGSTFFKNAISLLCISFIYSISAQSTCEAINSYVQITVPSITYAKTSLSAQALFQPFEYYIEPTELVILSSTDDICDGTSLSTDISDKVVLINPTNGDCANVTKVYKAQLNKAKAVLITNTETEIGIVSNLANDDEATSNQLSIPTRTIPHSMANELSSFSDTGYDFFLHTSLHKQTTKIQLVYVEFGCRNDASDISSILCLVDQSGQHWEIDGDYQLQNDVFVNGKHVWYKQGYHLVLDTDYYIFLNNDYYWTITSDFSNISNSKAYIAKCAGGSLSSPMDCSSWSTFSKNGHFELNEGIKVNNSLCEVTDNYICIESTQSSLSGLFGTYRQYHPNEPFWFREHNECDTQSGYLTFWIDSDEKGIFWLVDPWDDWIVAECIVTDYSRAELQNYVAFNPQICKEWHTLVDGSLDASHRIYDATLTIDTQRCGLSVCPTEYTVPTQMCMDRSSIMHSFLEGTYEQTGVYGAKHGTLEWKINEKLYYEGEYVPVYVWYYGEISDSLNWWVIAMDNLTVAQEYGTTSVYGYCASNTKSPSNCLACWNFYFAGSETNGAWHSDCKFQMKEDKCQVENVETTEPYDWPEYVCIRDIFLVEGNKTITYDGDIDFNLLIGGYEIDLTKNDFSNYPYWVKPPNDYNSNESYIYYDEFMGYWQIGDEISVESALFCMEDSADDYLPTHCSGWYDADLKVLPNMFLYTTNCGKDDIMKMSANDDKNGSDAEDAVIAVVVILCVLLCGVGIWCYFKKLKGDKGAHAFQHTSGRHSAASIELGDDVEANTLVHQGNGGTTAGHKSGGFDMTPLNPNEVGTDDDDMSDDETAKGHGIVDDEEQLITAGGNGDDDDEEDDLDLEMPSD